MSETADVTVTLPTARRPGDEDPRSLLRLLDVAPLLLLAALLVVWA